MGSYLLQVVAGLSLLVGWAVLLQAVRDVRKTTLRPAGQWSIAGLAVWTAAFIAGLGVGELSVGGRELCWYLTAVACACPPVAVLGARKPGAAAWGFFVLLPLVLVLLWPAAAATRVWRFGVPLELEEPALVAFSVVLVMGCGNYFGTKFTLPAMMYAGAVVLLLSSLSAVAPDFLRHQPQTREVATILLAASLGLARLRCVSSPASEDVWTALWLDFVDHYGQVWSKRVMDRLNESARYEEWSAHLEWHGLVWNSAVTEADRAKTLERLDHNMRWLLKRFVEPEWIDSRVGATSSNADLPCASHNAEDKSD